MLGWGGFLDGLAHGQEEGAEGDGERWLMLCHMTIDNVKL